MVNCVDLFRIFVVDVCFVYVSYQDVGVVDIDGQFYWIYEWVDDYVEVEFEDDIFDEIQMSELIYDMGVQFGFGYFCGISEFYGVELWCELVIFVGNEGESIWVMSGQFFFV